MAEESFYDKVYDIVRQIPAGRISSYGAIANYLGTGGTARMVGYAMKHAGSTHPPVPAHRVVNSRGLLTGRHAFPSPHLMQQMLESEGVLVEDDQVVGFKELHWDPIVEL